MLIDGLGADDSKEFSVHPEYNHLYDVPGLNVFRNPSCRAHATDLGIFKKNFEMVVLKITSIGSNISREFEERYLIYFYYYSKSN